MRRVILWNGAIKMTFLALIDNPSTSNYIKDTFSHIEQIDLELINPNDFMEFKEKNKIKTLILLDKYLGCDYRKILTPICELYQCLEEQPEVLLILLEDTPSKDVIEFSDKLSIFKNICVTKLNDLHKYIEYIPQQKANNEKARRSYLDVEFNKDKYKILLVDDNKLTQELKRKAFNDTIYEPIFANNGIEAYSLFLKDRPDLVLTNIDMPGIDGLELCKIIKAETYNDYLPILMMSSRSQGAIIEATFTVGGDGYIANESTPDQILEKVQSFFNDIGAMHDYKVLVVDDEAIVSNILRIAFIKNGINVITSTNGLQAYFLLLSEKPDLLISDINMPFINGYTLASLIRKNPLLSKMDILLMSWSDEKRNVNKSLELGVIQNFEKPFDVDKIVMLVKYFLKEKHHQNQREYELMIGSIKALVSALEARDECTSGHSKRVTIYAVQIAEELKLTSKRIEKLKIAAELHDVGKIGVRDAVLLKPGILTENEYDNIKSHPEVAFRILSHIDTLNFEANIIRYHHERWDGKGYPTGISKETIPIESRIISVADTFDALTSDRPYRNAKTLDDAVKTITFVSGTQLCPKCVRAFLKIKDNLLNSI
ncbi:response regulator [Clostridium sp.]|uniref:response regulator n=1 Tax=Clostridium sp. TaxID=1506 RepID=UPI003D6C9EB8